MFYLLNWYRLDMSDGSILKSGAVFGDHPSLFTVWHHLKQSGKFGFRLMDCISGARAQTDWFNPNLDWYEFPANARAR